MKKYLLLATVLLVLGCSVTKRIDKGIKPSEIQFLTKHNLSATIVTTPTLKNEKYMSKGGVCKIHLYPGNLNIFSGTLNNVFQSISISDENDDNINSDIKIILENTFERDQENKLYFIQSVHIFETLNNTKLNSFQSRILLSTSPGKIKSNIYKTVLIGTLGLSTFPLMQLRSEEIKQVLSKVMQEASLDIAKQISENDFIRQFAKDKSVYYKQVPNNENIIYGVLERPEVNYNIEDIVKNDLVDSNRRFTIFYSKSDYLHDLLKENKIEAALTFLDSNKNVIKIDKKLKHLLIKGREQLLDKYTLLFHETLYFLSETFPEDRKSNGFKFSSNVIQRISIAIENWKTLRRLLPNNKTLPEEKLLISKASNILKQEFLSFDHFGSENFFNFFPTDVFAFSFPTEYLTELINKEPDINKFKILWGKYKDEISDNDRAYKKFSRLFLNTFENKITRDQNDRILYVLECNHFIIEKNLHRDLLQKINVAIVMPPFLEKDSKIDIKNDLGYLDIDFIDTDNACKKGLDQFDLAIFIFLKETKLQHTLLSKEKISSKFIASYSVQPNPRYIGIQNLISELQNRILIASLNQNNTYSTSVAEALSNLSDTITLSSLRLQLRKARNLLINTPPTIKIPQYSSYKYQQINLDIDKYLELRKIYYNPAKKLYFIIDDELTGNSQFTVVSGLKESDPNKESINIRCHSEEEIAQWETKPFELLLSDIFPKYRDSLSAANIKSGFPEYQKMISANLKQSKRPEAKKNDVVSALITSDERFDSVVVVISKNSSIVGSGFFVSKNNILTNYHVIGDSRYVEIKLHNGNKCYGKVVKIDPVADLALVSVHEDGKPVSFYSDKSLAIGSTVEAIGHPSGLEYSLTRGIVSGVREHRIRNRSFVLIQTDTPINPGNSGGPLYLGNEVIGINTQKIVNTDIEGLGFALHITEIQSFLK